MGYTHYWSFKSIKGQALETETKYKKAIIECQELCVAFQKEFGGIAGYAAHTKPGTYAGLSINGRESESHEDFQLREHFKQNLESSYSGFCKTAQKPYDTLVVACLTILKHRLGDAITVDSDGDSRDWIAGVEYARRITGLKSLKMPSGIRNAKLWGVS